MTTKSIVVCDGCQRVKGEANHWLMAENMGAWFSVGHWNEAYGKQGRLLHICGMACYQKLLSEHLEASKPHPEDADGVEKP